MKKEKVVLWGVCDRADKVLKSVDYTFFEILAIVDNDKDKIGKLFHGIPIVGSEYINTVNFDRLVLCLGEKGVMSVKKQLGGINKKSNYTIENMKYFIKRSLCNKYNDTENMEIQQIVKFLDNHDIDVFNYEFVQKYNRCNIICSKDEENGLFYVIHNGKKMYMSRSFDSEEKVKAYYKSILIEQDEESPHRYLIKDYEVEDGMVVMDIGAAEGNFSLDIIDSVKKLYIVECEKEWLEALRYTFKDYMDKVVLIDKYISDYVSNNTTTIDEIINSKKLHYIKMDIEGDEIKALHGCDETFKNNRNLICNICTYHKHGDEQMVSEILEKYSFNIATSKGYMCFLYDDDMFENPELRRGLVRGKKGYSY